MKNNIKKISTAVLSLMLVIGFIFSATSCLYTMELLTNKTPDSSVSGTPDGKTDEGGSSSSETSGTENGTNGIQSSGTQFHPGANDPEDINGLLPEVRALISTVAIDAKLDLTSSYPYSSSGATTEYTSYGSGVIYSLDRERGDAYIITNYHVVYNKDEVANGGFSDGISLYLYGMENEQYAIPAKVVGGSMTYDIAVLRVEGSEVLKNSIASAVDLGNSEDVRVYDDVYVVGNPEGYGISATDGIVSVESENLSMVGADGRTGLNLRVMRISAAVNDGNSGGGLYSADGKLIGIVNAKRTGSDVDNIGYAIPVNLAKNLADNIIRNCDGNESLALKKSLIGIELEAVNSGLVSDGKGNLIITETVAVKTIMDNCITDKILAGDIINSIMIDGKKTDVTRTHHIIDAMLTADAKSTVVLNITRGSETLEITLTIPESAISTVK